MLKLRVPIFLALALCLCRVEAQTNTVPANAAAAKAGILLKPHVQALSPESVAIQWRTEQPAYGWVEYGETSQFGRKQDAAIHGLRVANVREHRVILEGLRPGARYWYRVCYKPILSMSMPRVEVGGLIQSEGAPLQTLPGPGDTVSVLVFNDLHNRVDTFTEMRKVVGGEPFDFSIFNGDCLADPEREAATLSTLEAFCSGVSARSRPAFFLRGNHELRGAFARELTRLLSWPGDKPYFGFTAGPVRFVVLDCGETRPDSEPAIFGLNDFDSFRREEAQWLKREIESPEFRSAAWRVLVHHVPLFTGLTTGYSQPARDLFAKPLARAGIDLALNAHTHGRAFHPANTIGAPYPVVIGGGPNPNEATVMILHANRQRLKLRILNSDGADVFPPFEKSRQ